MTGLLTRPRVGRPRNLSSIFDSASILFLSLVFRTAVGQTQASVVTGCLFFLLGRKAAVFSVCASLCLRSSSAQYVRRMAFRRLS